MADTALFEATSTEDLALVSRAQRTIAGVRENAHTLVAGDPLCSRRFTEGDAAVIEAMFVGVLTELQRVQARLAALEGR